MNTEEFSNEFDTLLNSYTNTYQGNLNFDEYEKSVFLTKAQEDIVIGLYDGNNILSDTIEKTEENRRYLSNLIHTYITSDKKEGSIKISKDSVFFQLPDDLWFITYESVTLKDDTLGCKNGENIPVIPVTQDEYSIIKENPFRGASNRRALRLDVDNNIVEIISKYNIDKYLVRYLSKPSPIILTDFTDSLSINGEKIKTDCNLNPVLHRSILERAVKLAVMSRVNRTGS